MRRRELRRHASGRCRVCPVAGRGLGLAADTTAGLAGTIGLAGPERGTIADLADPEKGTIADSDPEKDTIADPAPERGNAADLVLAGTAAGPADPEKGSTSAAMNRQQLQR